MAMETKTLMKMKTGVWVNREKMKRVLDKISLYYGVLISGMAFFSFLNGDYTMGTLQVILALPLWLIQFSYNRFQKMEAKQDWDRDWETKERHS